MCATRIPHIRASVDAVYVMQGIDGRPRGCGLVAASAITIDIDQLLKASHIPAGTG